ncbi:tetratricopeptide repeat protein [Candidatus Poribacteria bacterium]|nr:tetratricopeptide repeat protein [Candidatus Poribacteria bacterium]
MRLPESGGPITNRIVDLLGNSIELTTEYCCKYHPRKNATSMCECCGADLCSDCSNIRTRRVVCSKCMSTLDKTFSGMGPASLFTRVFTHPFAIALVLISILGYLLFSFGQTHRKGLLRGASAAVDASEEQLRLKMLLYAQKAERVETHADALREEGRLGEANRDCDRARTIYEMLTQEATGRWEHNIVTLARARLLEKMGEHSYAEGLYRSLANMPEPDKTYAAIAQFHLAVLQEKLDREKALETYNAFLRSLTFVPDNLSRALNVMSHTEGAYNYESRLRAATRTDFDFEKAKAEASLRMGRLLLALGRPEDAKDSFRLVLEEDAGSKLADQARTELDKMRAFDKQKEPLAEKTEHAEKVVITHFE